MEENEEYLEESEKKALHSEYIKQPILDVDFPLHSFDIVFASQAIERLDRNKRDALLDTMQRWASKKVIVVVRNESDALADFKRRGYRVYGIGGFKSLRTTSGGIQHRPWYFFKFLSDLSQKIAYFFPALAFQLFGTRRYMRHRVASTVRREIRMSATLLR